MPDLSQAPERDPRVTPVAGDVLSKPIREHAWRQRQVDEVTPVGVVYVGDDVCSPEITIRAWRRWAAGATVIKRAE